jgi:predicted nucleic acid-binding Zn ribbon protein
MPARQCPFCGKMISNLHSHCPFCREAVPPVPGSQAAIEAPSRVGGDGNRKIRQGLLYMLLAGVVQYFAGGYGGPIFNLPIQIQPIVTSYLAPLLFLCGLGLSIYGFFLHAKS